MCDLTTVLTDFRAIQESMLFPGSGDTSDFQHVAAGSSGMDQDLIRAIELSEREIQDSRTREEREDEELQRILLLSLQEK